MLHYVAILVLFLCMCLGIRADYKKGETYELSLWMLVSVVFVLGSVAALMVTFAISMAVGVIWADHIPTEHKTVDIEHVGYVKEDSTGDYVVDVVSTEGYDYTVPYSEAHINVDSSLESPTLDVTHTKVEHPVYEWLFGSSYDNIHGNQVHLNTNEEVKKP